MNQSSAAINRYHQPPFNLMEPCPEEKEFALNQNSMQTTENNDYGTADTCLDRRLRHTVSFFADRLAIVAPAISACYVLSYQ